MDQNDAKNLSKMRKHKNCHYDNKYLALTMSKKEFDQYLKKNYGEYEKSPEK
jgi:hypothetical protein